MTFHIKSISQVLISITALFLLTNTVSADHGKNFHCSSFSFKSDQAKSAIKELASGNHMKKIVKQYAYRWENEEIRRICKAASEGKAAVFSCLDGRRDWAAIKAKIPKGLFDQADMSLRPEMLRLQEDGANSVGRNEVLDYCEALGVVDRSVK